MDLLQEPHKILVLSNLFFLQDKGQGISIPEEGALYAYYMAVSNQSQVTKYARGRGTSTHSILAQ